MSNQLTFPFGSAGGPEGQGQGFSGSPSRQHALDPRFTMDPYDWLAYQQLLSGVPDIFRIALSPPEGAVIFIVGTTNQGLGRPNVSSYNIRFLPLDQALPAIMWDLDLAQRAIQNSEVIISTGAPGPGGFVQVQSESQFGRAGYYFATAVNNAGRESLRFAGPKLAPMPNGIVASATPPDVSDPDITVGTQVIGSYSRRVLTASATVPSNAKGVIAVSVLNIGSGQTAPAGTAIPLVFTGNGTGAAGVGIVDENAGIGVALVTQTGNGYTLPPTVTAPPGSAVLQAILGDGTEFAGYQIYIANYFLEPVALESVVITGANSRRPNQVMEGQFFLMPDTPIVGAHDIDFYFVSVSPTGARRSDPTNAPAFTLVGGLV